MTAPDQSESVLILFDGDEPSERFEIETENRRTPGWVTLVRFVQCPGHCMGGEVLWGSDLHACSTCGGNGVVSIGVGGARIHGSYRFPLPEDPEVIYWRNDVRDYIPPSVSFGRHNAAGES